MKQKEIKVLMVAPGEHPREVVLKNDLDALQKAVSIGCDYRGLIEVVGLEDGVCIICNEEGKLLGLANWCKNSPGDCFWPVGRSMDCKLHPKWVRDAIHNKECPNKIPRGSVL